MPDEVQTWIQNFLGDKDVFIIRAIEKNDKQNMLNGTLPTDRLSNFVPMTHLHIINESSVQDLKS